MPAAPAGSMNQRAQFLRRGPDGYLPLGDWQWSRFAFERSSEIQHAGVSFQGRAGRLTVHDCDLTRGLRTSDRVRMDEHEFAITIRKAKAADSDDVDLEIESALTPTLYADEFDRRGTFVTLRRPGTPPIEAKVRALVWGYSPQELASGVQQGDRHVLLLAADVVAAGFPLPIKSAQDRLIVRGKAMAIQSVDESTHRIGDELLAFEIQARGA